MTAPRGSGSRAVLGAAWLLALLAFILATVVNARTSATVDEPNYIAAGLSFWKTGDYRMHPDSPPLAPGLGGLAALTLGPEVPTSLPASALSTPAAVVSATVAWEKANDWEYGALLLNEVNRPLARELVFRARLPIALAGASLVLVVFVWARSLRGDAAGLGAAGLAAFSPTWLAHSAVLSCDVLVSVLLAATVFVAARAFVGGSGSLSAPRSAALGMLAFAAFSSKFTALALLPLLPLLAGAILLARRRDEAVPAPGEAARYLLRAGATALVLLALLGYPGAFGLAKYLTGVRAIYRNVNPDDFFFFLGAYSHHGWPLYGTTCLLLKATLGTLALGLAGGVVATRSARSNPGSLAPLLLVGVILAASLADPAAYGVRRVLPAFPALFVLGGVALGAAFDARASRRGKVALGLATALLASHVLSSLRAFPACLPYVNEVTRTLGEPTDFFADSNVDWGQALPDLARAIEARRPARVKLASFGWIDPAIYGVVAEPLTREDLVHPEPGVLYALSAQTLVQNRRRVLAGELPPEADWLARARPVARAGDAIALYELGRGLR